MQNKLNESKILFYHDVLLSIKKEISKIIVGQDSTINALLVGLLSNGHILVEGIPGIAKTLLIRALSQTTGGVFSRIQFTVDLLPTDITGITAYNPQKGFYVVKGPIFANFLLADEINRAPAKVQSALLEAMQERQTTIGKQTFPMMNPFFVMATQNPIETSGTYPLPEAQIDRFLFKLYMGYPTLENEKKVLRQNIQLKKFEEYNIMPIISPQKLIEMQKAVQEVYLGEEIEKYIIRIVDSTRNSKDYNVEMGKYIQWGGSPRASIGLYIASKANAFMQGSSFVTPQHVKEIAYPILRHRIILNYEGLADDIKSDSIIKEILAKVPIP